MSATQLSVSEINKRLMELIKIFGAILLFQVRSSAALLRDFTICHDDFSLKPPDGILKANTFTWLGFVQYVHVTTGLPHHSKAPRVTLIHRQFTVGTATDLLRLPKNYKLGQVVFGDYERDEEECGMTLSQLKYGMRCPRAYLEIPVVEITPHPEYSRFGVGNSLVLVKLLRPLRSSYTIPICLPSLVERERKRKSKIVYLIDYISPVPRDFDSERLAKKTMRIYTHKECRKHRLRMNLGSEGVTHALCSSGCGVRHGAPIISHNLEGQFELLGIAAASAQCARRAQRRRLNPDPPVYIDVYPYIGWLVNVITANTMPLAYPQNFRLVDGGSGISVHKKGFLRSRKHQRYGWKARTFVSGNFCFKNMRKQKRGASIFYSEKFEVNANPPAKLNVFMMISAGIETTIMCARMTLPNRLLMPKIDGVGGYNISVAFSTAWFPYAYYFTLALSGSNTTRSNMKDWILEKQSAG